MLTQTFKRKMNLTRNGFRATITFYHNEQAKENNWIVLSRLIDKHFKGMSATELINEMIEDLRAKKAKKKSL